MEDHPAFWGVYVTVDDVDAATAKVAAAGGWVDAEPFVMDLGRMAAIADPTGARSTCGRPRHHRHRARQRARDADLARAGHARRRAATAFYAEVLGVSWEAQPMGDGPPYTCLVVDGRQVGGRCRRRWRASRPTGASTSPSTTSTRRSSRRRARRHGGRPAFDVPGVGRMAVLADPRAGCST